jgi:hypothetical protein
MRDLTAEFRAHRDALVEECAARGIEVVGAGVFDIGSETEPAIWREGHTRGGAPGGILEAMLAVRARFGLPAVLKP